LDWLKKRLDICPERGGEATDDRPHQSRHQHKLLLVFSSRDRRLSSAVIRV
jgi:hypothetical protein